MIYGYLRAIENCNPERDISFDSQLEILKQNKQIEIIFQDKITTKTSGRENFYILIESVKQDDIIIVTKLSRIAENFKELSEICSVLSLKGVLLNILELGDMTGKPCCITNEKWLKALSKFENDIKYEHICRGHLKSKNNQQSDNNLHRGTPAKYSNKQLSEALKLRDKYTFKEISSLTGISKSTLLRANKKMQL